MFANIPEDISQILLNEEVTVNAHQFCITDEVSTKDKLRTILKKLQGESSTKRYFKVCIELNINK